MQCHFLCHLCAELEQIGCGYSEAFLGQNFEPFYQRDKAAGLVTYDDAVFMFENLSIKLNEISYYFGEEVAKQNSADLGQSITLVLYRGRWRCDRGDGLRDPRRLRLPGLAPASAVGCDHPAHPGKLIEKCFDVIGTGLGMPSSSTPR